MSIDPGRVRVLGVASAHTAARSGDIELGGTMVESHLRVNKTDKSMESSLSRSLRSLLAAAALLMAAYAIAASPNGAWSTRSAPGDAVAFLAPLASVQQELGFGSGRHGTSATAQPEEPTAPVSSSLAWVFAGLCLIGALAQRRLLER